MKNIILLLLTSVAFTVAIAQQKTKPVFNSYTAAGIQIGQSDPSATTETVNGIKYGNWFAGAGVAYSAYKYRSLPIFFDARYSFGNKKQFFINGDIGYNMNIKTNYEEDMFYYDVKYKGGMYLNSGMGYLLQPAKKHSFYVQLNYGIKQDSKIVKEFIWIDFPPYNRSNENYYTYKYVLKTVEVKLGFKF